MDHSADMDKGAFRVKDWWSKASLLMGMIYLFAERYHISFEKFIPLSMLSLATISGFASMGYLFNDLFDLKKDAIAGKRNFIAGKPAPVVVLLFIASAAFVLLPWWFLPKTRFSFVLIGVQILLFILYSVPPIRLKERGLAGVITDALYAHGLPTFLAAYTFSLAANYLFPTPDIFLLFTWQVIAGVRNIILHQADDIDADRKSGSQNFVARLPAQQLLAWLKWLTKIELLLGLSFFAALLFSNILFSLCILVVVVLSAIYFSAFAKNGDHQFLKGTWRFFPNNIYEKWLPVAYLILLSVGDLRFVILLILQVALFNFDFYVQVAIWAYGRWKSIPFRGYLILIRIFISYPINYFIYYLFRIFGIDLKKENISAMAYLRKRLGT